MDIVEREQLNQNQTENHWYYESKYALLKKHILSLELENDSFTTADVGSGIGLFLHKLERDGLASPKRSLGIDPAYKAAAMAFRSSIPIQPAFPQQISYDIILMMDVLEHVEDDLALLRDVIPRIKTGGYVLITVPALPFLWSSHDVFLGHYRRYTLNSLKKLILNSDKLEILKTHYYFASILPAAIPVRLLNFQNIHNNSSDMKLQPSILNFMLKMICNAELGISHLNQLFGLTAVALCKKK